MTRSVSVPPIWIPREYSLMSLVYNGPYFREVLGGAGAFSVDDKQPSPDLGERTVRAVVVRHLIAGARRQGDLATVVELGVQHAVQHIKDVTLGAPKVGEIAGRIFNDPYPDTAKLASTPTRRTGLAGMQRLGHIVPVCRAERDAMHVHRRRPQPTAA